MSAQLLETVDQPATSTPAEAPAATPAPADPSQAAAQNGEGPGGNGTPAADGKPGEQKERKFSVSASRQFPSWMREHHVSLAFTTYQAGRLFLVGMQENKRLSVFERQFQRCLGLWTNGQTIWMNSLYQLWRLENFVPPGQTNKDGYDRMYVPTVGFTTGDIDIHDIAITADNRVVFVNTLFGCLATVNPRHSFVPIWKPPFLSKLAAEDRCHLNGLALENGQPAYISAISRSDTNDGWREHREKGGIVMDIRTNEVVCEGLSMPHSPRVYRDKLWVLNSGGGDFGYVDRKTGKFEPVCFCPGYARGLSFHGDFAAIGLSMPRHNKCFSGLPLDGALAKREVQPRCGIQIVDLRTGDSVHWFRLEGAISELYDVVMLPGVKKPMAVGFRTEEIHRTISVGQPPGAGQREARPAEAQIEGD